LRRARVPLGTSRGRRSARRSTSWVRCICGGRGRFRDGGCSALERRFCAWSPTARSCPFRSRVRVVCAWRGLPQSRRSRLTQPISGGGRRGQDERVSAERSELRSSRLDAGGRPELRAACPVHRFQAGALCCERLPGLRRSEVGPRWRTLRPRSLQRALERRSRLWPWSGEASWQPEPGLPPRSPRTSRRRVGGQSETRR